MAIYHSIPRRLYKQLKTVPASTFRSHSGKGKLRPCLVTLRDGRRIDMTYVLDEDTYRGAWNMRGSPDREIMIDDVVEIEESPSRLPPAFAMKVYEAGETGMGYVVFTVVFASGATRAFGSGRDADFIVYPEGLTASDVTDVIPHKGATEPNVISVPEFYWCVYGAVSRSD